MSAADESRALLHDLKHTNHFKNTPEAVVREILRLNDRAVRLETTIEQLSDRVAGLQVTVAEVDAAVKALAAEHGQMEKSQQASSNAVRRVETVIEATRENIEDYERRLVACERVGNTEIPSLRNDLFAIRCDVERKDRNHHALDEQLLRVESEKVDSHLFEKALGDLKLRLDNMLLPQNGANHGGGGSVESPCGRWTWIGGPFDAHRSRAIVWSERVLRRGGKGLSWNKSNPSVVVVNHGGVYRVSVGVFHNAAAHSVPSITVYLNDSAVVNATNSSSYVLQQSTKRTMSCTCAPVCVNGLTMSDFYYIPQGSLLGIVYHADQRDIVEAFLELEAFY